MIEHKAVFTQDGKFVKLFFKGMKDELYWPSYYPLYGLYLIINETFDEKHGHFYENALTRVEPDDVVVDVGAAEGLFSLSVINRCRKVIMIEPNGNFVEALNNTFRGYIGTGKAVILPAAAGDREGRIRLIDDGASSTVAESGEPNVELRTLDGLLENEGKIGYLKIDVEGSEMEVLKGAKRIIQRDKPKIAAACYHKNNEPDLIMDLLKGFVPGYRVFKKGVTPDEPPKPVILHFAL